MAAATVGMVGWLLVEAIGLAIGVAARRLMPGPHPGGRFVTLQLGVHRLLTRKA